MTEEPKKENVTKARKLFASMLDDINQYLIDNDLHTFKMFVRELHDVPPRPLNTNMSSDIVEYMRKKGIVRFKPERKDINFQGLIDCLASETTSISRVKTLVHSSWNNINATLDIPLFNNLGERKHLASGDDGGDANKKKRKRLSDVSEVQNDEKGKRQNRHKPLPPTSVSTPEDEPIDKDYLNAPQFHEDIELFRELKSERKKSSKSSQHVNQYFTFRGQLVHKTKVLNKGSTQYSWAYVCDSDKSVVKVTLFNDVAIQYANLKVGFHYKFSCFYCRDISDEFLTYDVIQNRNITVKASSYYSSTINQIESLDLKMSPDEPMSLYDVCNATINTRVSLRDCLVIHLNRNNSEDGQSEKESYSLVLADSDEHFVRVSVVMYEEMEFSVEKGLGSVVEIRYGRVVHNELGTVSVEIYSEIKEMEVKDTHWSKTLSVDNLLTEYKKSLRDHVEIHSVMSCQDPKYHGKTIKLQASIQSFGTIDKNTIYKGCPDKNCQQKEIQKIGMRFSCNCNPQKKFSKDKLCVKFDLSVKLASHDSEEVFFRLKHKAIEKLLSGNRFPESEKELREKVKHWKKEAVIVSVICNSKGQSHVSDLDFIDDGDQD